MTWAGGEGKDCRITQQNTTPYDGGHYTVTVKSSKSQFNIIEGMKIKNVMFSRWAGVHHAQTSDDSTHKWRMTEELVNTFTSLSNIAQAQPVKELHSTFLFVSPIHFLWPRASFFCIVFCKVHLQEQPHIYMTELNR